MELKKSEFRELSRFVYDQFGINLPDNKKGMVEARLTKLFRKEKSIDFPNYLNKLKTDRSGDALSELVNAISTNHTFFYRESEHFSFFTDQALPEIVSRLKRNREKDIRIWSAGCSSGEEPYMLVMLMKDYLKEKYANYEAGILASDIDTNVLKTGKSGIYPKERLEAIPPNLRSRFFQKLPEGNYTVTMEVKKEVLFKRFNLMNPFPFKSRFHIIFCRNVMIYFDKPTRENLIDKFHNALLPGGYLFIGHSETIERSNSRFEYVRPALYRKR